MAVEKGAADLDHIEFQREPNRQPERRRRRRGFGQPPPRPADRNTHGNTLATETQGAVSQVQTMRQAAGIDPARLFVLEFDAVNVELREELEARFAAIVVDERREQTGGQDRLSYVVQFADQAALDRFQLEVGHYRNENAATTMLPQGARRDFFDALQHVRSVTRGERRGRRLTTDGIPPVEPFYLDVDLWHPGETQAAKFVRQQVREFCGSLGGVWRDAVQTRSLMLGKVHANRALCERLLDLDWVARVDLPAQVTEAYHGIFRDDELPILGRVPDERDGLACVIDSGVLSAHPYLSNWILEERDFDSGENTAADLNGHGTSVAGLVVYGDIAECIESSNWVPRVQICNAKVLRHDRQFDRVMFPEENRLEEELENSIRHFHGTRGCRIFNISIGDDRDIYAGGRQFPLAEKLDELARELDVVIVIAAGNRGDAPIPAGALTRQELQAAIRDQLLADEGQRLCNPATASLAVTVGAIARSDAVHGQAALVPGAPANAPAPFSRIGPGYAASDTAAGIKPEFMAPGGNFGIQTLAGNDPRWTQVVWLGEPTIRPERDGRLLTALAGTSFAAPHVTHAAACLERSLSEALGRNPTANGIRAVLGAYASPTDFQREWIADDEQRLKACGYGTLAMPQALWSVESSACLLAEDVLEEEHIHIYRVGVPNDFLEKRGKRGIAVALAFDPPVRASRRDYLARTMTLDVLHGLSEDEVELYRSHRPGATQLTMPTRNDLKPIPARTKVERSTLQVRSQSWSRRPQIRQDGEGSPVIHVVVTCRQRFPSFEDPRQRYALAVRLWHADIGAQIHTQLRALVRTVTRVRV